MLLTPVFGKGPLNLWRPRPGSGEAERSPSSIDVSFVATLFPLAHKEIREEESPAAATLPQQSMPSENDEFESTDPRLHLPARNQTC